MGSTEGGPVGATVVGFGFEAPPETPKDEREPRGLSLRDRTTAQECRTIHV